MNTMLFGFDLVVLFASFLKLLQEAFALPAKMTKYLGALFVVVAVVVVGLQTQGVILGPETEQWVILALTAISAGLAALGFGPGAVGTALAIADHVRFTAASKRAALTVKTFTSKATPAEVQEHIQKLDEVLSRYNIHL